MLRYHEHRDRTFGSRARTHVRHVHADINAESEREFAIHERKDSVLS